MKGELATRAIGKVSQLYRRLIMAKQMSIDYRKWNLHSLEATILYPDSTKGRSLLRRMSEQLRSAGYHPSYPSQLSPLHIINHGIASAISTQAVRSRLGVPLVGKRIAACGSIHH